MNALRLSTLAISALVATAAFAQNSAPFATPNGRQGKNFWFGNNGQGPSLHSSAGYDWDASNRAWYEYDGSSNSYKGAGGASGFGQAFTGFTAGAGWNFNDVIQARTTINVRPYVYVDGYFGLISDVQGWGYAKVPLGSSTFFVLHNAPVYVRFSGFTDANQIGTVGVANGVTIPVDYSATVFATYPNPGSDNTQFQSQPTINFGPRSGSNGFYLDPVVHTNFFGRIDVSRVGTLNYNVPAGKYVAVGTVIISAL